MLRTQAPGVKFHRSDDGKIRPCTASVRDCPKQHYLTEADAEDYRPRVVRNADINDLVNFNVSYVTDELGNIRSTPDTDGALNKLSNDVEGTLRRTGHRPKLPFGSIDIDLGGERRLNVKRENFLKYDKIPTTRYYITFWHNDSTYEIASAEMESNTPDKVGYLALQNHLQILLIDAKDKYAQELNEEVANRQIRPDVRDARLVTFDKAVQNSYEKLINDIDQIEVLTIGADKAMSRYGIDLFDRSNPKELNLDIDCSQNPIKSHDIVDSLRIHSAQDKNIRDISLKMTDRTMDETGNTLNRWSLTRNPSGQWFFSFETENMSHVQPVNPSNPEDVTNIGTVIDAYSVDAHEKKEFITRMLHDVDPAISSYQKTVEARLAAPQPPKVQIPTQQGQGPQNGAQHNQNPKISVKSKLSGLFR